MYEHSFVTATFYKYWMINAEPQNMPMQSGAAEECWTDNLEGLYGS